MRPFTSANALIAVGLALLLAGAALLFAPTPQVRAQDLPPRPTIVPAPTSAPPTAQPTQRPSSRDDDKDKRPAAPATGRITGTVIDQRTGVPVPGVAVTVGDVTVYTDANGNYERVGLVEGTYVVALVPPTAQSVASQGPIPVQLPAGGNVIQHLAFRSPEPPAPPAVAPAPTVAPIVPPALPNTSGPQAVRPPAPQHLPNTGASDAGGTLALLGGVLVLLGLVLKRRR